MKEKKIVDIYLLESKVQFVSMKKNKVWNTYLTIRPKVKSISMKSNKVNC